MKMSKWTKRTGSIVIALAAISLVSLVAYQLKMDVLLAILLGAVVGISSGCFVIYEWLQS